MKKFNIGIIIINFNNSELTINCVKSINKHTSSDINYQIIIVDNSSSFDDYSQLVKLFHTSGLKFAELIRSDINTGFGGGNMFGIHHVKADYYAFINNDSILQNDCLSILKTYMDNHPEVAVCGPEILNENQERQVSFGHFASLQKEILGKSFLEWLNPKKYPDRKKIYDEPLKVNYVNGSFMFCRSDDFHNVGGFDTNFFLFYEESDLCYRLFKNNKLTYFVPEAKYIHLQGKSLPESITTKIELKTSMFYVIQKHQGYLAYLLLKIILLLKYSITCIFKPRYLPLLYRIFIGIPISQSIKTKQKVVKL
jgi:GT2 family glycosyltransferase